MNQGIRITLDPRVIAAISTRILLCSITTRRRAMMANMHDWAAYVFTSEERLRVERRNAADIRTKIRHTRSNDVARSAGIIPLPH
jgi:hypothetical protein